MMLQHSDFRIYGEAEPVIESLLGQITQWSPKGSIDYKRPKGSLVELTRFRLRDMKLGDKQLAECFGLELGRLILEICSHDLAIARDETERKLVLRSRSHR